MTKPYNKNYKKRPLKDKNISETNTKNNQSYESNSIYSTYSYLLGVDIFNNYQPEEISRMIRNPMLNNKMLRDISLMLYNANGAYTNTVDYMKSMPTLDYVIVSYGQSPQKKKKNESLMESTLKRIKHKQLVRDALFKGMLEGVAFYYFETTKMPNNNKKFMSDFDVEGIFEINETGINASIIPLPTDYTQIVGRVNGDYVLAFNLDYFNQGVEPAQVKIRKYPKEIRDAYASRNTRANGNWVVLDSNKVIVHKIRSKMEEKWGRPLILAGIDDITYKDYFKRTKRHVLDEVNNKTVVQTLPPGKENGTCALNKTQQENQHKAVKSAITTKNSRGGTCVVTVAPGTKIEAINTQDTTLFDSKNESNLDENIALDLGISLSTLNGSGSTTYASQTINLELISAEIFEWIDQISSEINKVINKNIIKDERNEVCVQYIPTTHVNKKEMVQNMKDLYLQGKGSLSAWSSACGLSPMVFYSLLDKELEMGIEEKYPVHQTSYTLSSKDGDKKKSETDNPTENTVRSRANDGNNLPSPN